MQERYSRIEQRTVLFESSANDDDKERSMENNEIPIQKKNASITRNHHGGIRGAKLKERGARIQVFTNSLVVSRRPRLGSKVTKVPGNLGRTLMELRLARVKVLSIDY